MVGVAANRKNFCILFSHRFFAHQTFELLRLWSFDQRIFPLVNPPLAHYNCCFVCDHLCCCDICGRTQRRGTTMLQNAICRVNSISCFCFTLIRMFDFHQTRSTFKFYSPSYHKLAYDNKNHFIF